MSGPDLGTGTPTTVEPEVGPVGAPVDGSLPGADPDSGITPASDDLFVSTTIADITDAERDMAFADPAANLATIEGWGNARIQAHITAVHIAAIPADKVVELPTSFFNALTAEQIAGFNAEQMANVTKAQLAAIEPTALTAIDQDALRAIPVAAVTAFTPDHISALPIEFAIHLTDNQMDAIEALGEPGVASNPLLHAVRERFAERLHGPGLDLTEHVFDELALWDSAQIQALVSPAAVATINPDIVRQLPPSFVRGLGNSAEKFTSAQLGKLTPQQVFALSDEQVKSLTAAALRGVSTEQLNALSRSQVRNLDADQRLAIKGIPGGDALIQIADGNGVIDATEMRALLGSTPAPDLSQLSLVEIESCHPHAITALGEKITELNTPLLSQLSQAQVAALTPEQVTKLCADPAAGNFEALGSLVKHLSTAALEAVPDSMPASPVVDYAREVLRTRRAVVTDAQRQLENGRPSGIDPDLANLEALRIPYYDEQKFIRNSAVAGGPVEAAVVMDLSVTTHQYTIPLSVNHRPDSNEPFKVIASHHEIKNIHIPIDGTDAEQQKFNADYTAAMQDFLDKKNEWDAISEHIDDVRRANGGLVFKDITQFPLEHRPEMQRLLQARLDKALEIREAHTKLQDMVRAQGYNPNDPQICPNFDPKAIAEDYEWHDYVDFTPMLSEKEMEVYAGDRMQEEIDNIPEPEVEFYTPVTSALVTRGTAGTTVVRPEPAPALEPGRTIVAAEAAPVVALKNGEVYNIVVRYPAGTEMSGSGLESGINRIEDLNGHARAVYGVERGTLYTEMSTSIAEIVKNNPGVTIEVTPATAAEREDPIRAGVGAPSTERHGVWAAAAAATTTTARPRDDADDSI